MDLFELVSGPARSSVPLLTAVIGTASTLVAIIGGLLVARVASMAQARESAKQRVADADTRRDIAQNEVERMLKVDLDLDRSAWIAKAVPELVKAPKLGRAYLESRCGVWSHSHDELTPHIDNIRDVIEQAKADIESAAAGQNVPRSWDNFRSEHGLRPSGPVEAAVYEEVYAGMWERQEAKRVHDQAQVAERELGQATTVAQRIAAQRTAARNVALRAASRPTSRQYGLKSASSEERRTVSMSLGNAQARLKDAEDDLVRAQSSQRINEIPPYTWPAIAILSYLGVADVGLPLLLLATQPTELGPGWRWGLVGTLLLGVVGLVSVLIRNLRSEHRKPDNKRRTRKSSVAPTAN